MTSYQRDTITSAQTLISNIFLRDDTRPPDLRVISYTTYKLEETDVGEVTE